MASAVDRAVQVHAAAMKRIAGTEVLIVRGAQKSEPITGTLTVSMIDVWDVDTGIPTKVRSHDWLFTQTDLVLDGKQITLRPGDNIETVNSVEADVRRFEVQPIANKPCIEPHDAAGYMVIVHTREVTCQPKEC